MHCVPCNLIKANTPKQTIPLWQLRQSAANDIVKKLFRSFKKGSIISLGHKVKIFKLLCASSWNGCLLLQRLCYREKMQKYHLRTISKMATYLLQQIWRHMSLVPFTLLKYNELCMYARLRGYTKVSGSSVATKFEPVHVISNNVVSATCRASDQPAHTRSLIRAFASRLCTLWLLSYWLNTIWSF